MKSTNARRIGGICAAALCLTVTVAGCGNDHEGNGNSVSPTASASPTASIAPTVSVPTPHIGMPIKGTLIPKFVDPLPTFNGRRADGTSTLHVDMREFQQKVLPDSVYAALPSPYNNGTFLWGYDIDSAGPSWPARTIEVQQGTATDVVYSNNLANTVLQSALRVDQSLHWADPLGTTANNNCVDGAPLAPACTEPFNGPIPAVVHLHGAEVASAFDGHPDAWFTPGQDHTGRAFVSNSYHYVNQQEATTLWFHDHTLGTVRQNVFAGLAGFYLIRDARDSGRADNPITLPSGDQEVELLIQDRQFDSNGQLYFPFSDESLNLNGPPGNPDMHPFWIPEFFGDVMTVNGKSWPVLEVQPRRYRFHMLNGSNARFLIMQLFDQQGTDMHVNGTPGPAIWQIGSDGGFLDNPVKLDDPAHGPDACAGSPTGNNIDPQAGATCLFLAPAERDDVIIDFAGYAGKTFTMKNFAVIPFPSGGPVGFGDPDPTADGLVMQFKVDLPLQGTDTTFDPAGSHPALRASPIVDIKSIAPDKLRQLILIEEEGDPDHPDGPGSPDDEGDPVESLINNTKWNGNREGTTEQLPGSVSNNRGLSSTETPQVGSTEVWQIANLTGDAHPIHIHLIQFQVISRQTFDVDTYLADWIAAFPGGTYDGVNFAPGVFIPGFGPPMAYNVPNAAGALGGNLDFTASKYTQHGMCEHGMCTAAGPEAGDAGWKDTVKMFPGTITTLALRWAPQDLPVGGVTAGENPFPFEPSDGPGYVEHCHILDHEDNEFMRPLLIQK